MLLSKTIFAVLLKKENWRISRYATEFAKIDPEDILEMNVVMTIVDGKIVFEENL